MANGTKLQQLTTASKESFERTLQSARDFNQKLDVLAQSIEALRKEEARRYEIVMQEDARRHEQLLELIRRRFLHTSGEGTIVQAPTEEKEPIPIHIRTEKRVSSVVNSVIDQSAAVKKVEKGYHDDLQMNTNRRPEMALSESVSKPDELLKLLAAHPPLSEPAYNALDGHTTSVKIETTPNAAENNTHIPKDGINYNFVEGATTSEEKKMQGPCEECRKKYVTGHQYKSSSLHTLHLHIEADKIDELETTNKGGELEQERTDYLQLEINSMYEMVLKESVNKPEELLRLHATQPSPTKPIPAIAAPHTKNRGSEGSNKAEEK